jgi:hypothetical protein
VDVIVDTDAAGVLTVLVRDNGRGIQEISRRSGLANMADRAEKLGGQLRVAPADGGGTELEWKVLLPPDPADLADGAQRQEPQGKYPLPSLRVRACRCYGPTSRTVGVHGSLGPWRMAPARCRNSSPVRR